jgi:hypothetical protein
VQAGGDRRMPAIRLGTGPAMPAIGGIKEILTKARR